jgi:hypothetical protein
LRWYRIIVAVGATVLFAWPVVHALGGGSSERWAVMAGLLTGVVSFALLSVGWERLSRRGARLMMFLFLIEVVVIVPMLFDADLARRAFAGAVMLCFVGSVVLAMRTGWPRGLAEGFTRSAISGRDQYLDGRKRAERTLDITGRPPLITSFPIAEGDQVALMDLADRLRRSRRRFRPGEPARGRLLFAGGDALGKAQLAASIAYRADSPLLNTDWTNWDSEGDREAAFSEAFALAKKRRIGVIVLNGLATRLTDEDARSLGSAIDAIDWPLVLIATVAEPRDLGWAITRRLDRTVRLDEPLT